MSALSSAPPLLGARPRSSGPSGRRAARRRLGLHLGRHVATTGLLVVLGVALLAAVPGLRKVLREIRHIGPGWIAVAVALELASAVSFVVVFRLFFDRLDARDGRLLGWTEQGAGALIPGGGAGGLAIGGWLIHLTGVPVRWIARRSAGLFFLGVAVSSTALVGAGLALIAGVPGPHDLPTVVLPTVLAAIGTLLIAALPAILSSWPHPPRWLAAIAIGVGEAEQTTFHRRPNWRLVGALGYLAFDIAVLWVILRAIGPAPTQQVPDGSPRAAVPTARCSCSCTAVTPTMTPSSQTSCSRRCTRSVRTLRKSPTPPAAPSPTGTTAPAAHGAPTCSAR
jgi:hypothetical protein